MSFRPEIIGIAVDDTPTNQDLGSGLMTGNRLLEAVPI